MSTIETQVKTARDRALAAVTNLAKKETAKKETAAAGLSFHAKQKQMKNDDPDNTVLQAAQQVGRKRAQEFMASVKNPDDKDHEKNLRIFKNRHDMDARKAVDDFTEDACKEFGAAPYEQADYSYEQNVLRPYRPVGDTTAEKMAFYGNMQKALAEKHFAKGYAGDKAFIEDYANKYGLTRNDTTLEMRNIRPKP